MLETTVYDKLLEDGHGLTNHLVGVICTLLDSTLVDGRQAKAAKDIATGDIWRLQRERIDRERETLLYHRRNPTKSALLPEWLEKEEIDRETITEKVS